MQRLLVAVSCSLLVLAAPALGHASSWPLCSDVTCTGGTPTLTQSTGGLAHPEIIPIFWGQYWNAPDGVTQGAKIGQLQYIVNGPFLGALGQYNANGVGPARMVPAAPINTSAFPNPPGLLDPCSQTKPCGANEACDSAVCRLTPDYASSQLCVMVNAMISNTQVPPPLAEGTGADVVYTVLIPATDVGFPSHDRNFWCNTNPANPSAGIAYRALWAWGDDAAGLSHEIVESITNNVGVSGCGAADQIADLCGCYNETAQQADRSGCGVDGASCLDGSECCSWSCGSNGQCTGQLWLEAYWSRADSACVIPEAWNGVYEYASADDTWTQIGGTVRQIYAGGMGVVATRGDDNVYLYGGTPDDWNEIGVAGSMFSVGQSWILGLTPTADNVARYDGTSFTFTSFGPASAVYSGGFDILTDYQGNAWQYLGNSQAAQKVGSPGDQFLVGDDWAASLGFQRQNVWLFGGYVAGQQNVWTATGHAASELFVGGNQALAARDLTASPGVHAMTASGAKHPNGWQAMGGTGTTTFALSGDTGAPLASVAWSSSSDTGVVDLETQAIGSGSWGWKTDTFGAAGRLVGQGASLYATGPVVYCIPSGDPCGQQGNVCCSKTCQANGSCE